MLMFLNLLANSSQPATWSLHLRPMVMCKAHMPGANRPELETPEQRPACGEQHQPKRVICTNSKCRPSFGRLLKLGG